MKFFAGPFCGTREHRVPATQNNVVIEVLSDIQVALHDRLVDHLMESRHFEVELGMVENRFNRLESLVAEGDHLAVRKGIGTIVSISFFVV